MQHAWVCDKEHEAFAHNLISSVERSAAQSNAMHHKLRRDVAQMGVSMWKCAWRRWGGGGGGLHCNSTATFALNTDQPLRQWLTRERSQGQILQRHTRGACCDITIDTEQPTMAIGTTPVHECTTVRCQREEAIATRLQQPRPNDTTYNTFGIKRSSHACYHVWRSCAVQKQTALHTKHVRCPQ